jgi:Protein of unknown function (DUF4242)
VPTFLIETYEPNRHGESLADIERRSRTVAAELSREGTAVRYLRLIYVPADETCFYIVEGASLEVIEELARRAGLIFDRITEAVEPVTADGAQT